MPCLGLRMLATVGVLVTGGGGADFATEPSHSHRPTPVQILAHGLYNVSINAMSRYVLPDIPRDIEAQCGEDVLRGCTMKGSLYAGSPDCDDATPDRAPLEMRMMRDIFEAAARYHHFRAECNMHSHVASEEVDDGRLPGILGQLQAGAFDVALAPYILTVERLRLLRPTALLMQEESQLHVRCVSDSTGGHLVTVAARIWHSGVLLALTGAATIVTQVVVLHRTRPWHDAILRSVLDACAAACETVAPTAALTAARSQPPSPPAAASSSPVAALHKDAPGLIYPTASDPAQPSLASCVRSLARCVWAAWLLLVLNLNVGLKGMLTAESSAHEQPHAASLAELAADHKLVVGLPSPVYVNMVGEALDLPSYRTTICGQESGQVDCKKLFEKDEHFAVVKETVMPTGIKCLSGCHRVLNLGFSQTPIVLLLRRASRALGEALDRTILRLQAGGVIQQWLARDKAQRELWVARRTPESASSSMVVWDSFVFLGYGLATAGTVFCLELTASTVLKRREMQTTLNQTNFRPRTPDLSSKTS